MQAHVLKRLLRILTSSVSVLILASCGQGDGPQPIAGTPATPLPDLPPGYCDGINFEILCAPPTIVNFNGGATTIIDNPDASGINDSDKVAQMQKFPDEVFGGTKFELGDAIDFSKGEAYTIKVWSPRGVDVLFKLEETGNPGGGFAATVNHSGAGTWEELCFSFAGQNVPPPVTALTIIFDNGEMGAADTDPNNWTFYYDDIMQVASCGGGGGAEPDVAAPTPTDDPADVISIFSDAYTDVAGIDYNPDWGQATVVTQVDIAGDNTLKYAGLNYQGTDFSGNPQDVSGMESLHVDFWTADSTALSVTLISAGPVEATYTFAVATDTWVSVDIPLTTFAGIDLTGVIQLKFDGDGTVFLDNLYFVDGGAPAPTEPVVAAPTPTADAANVISLFSDAYTDITGVDYNPNWGQATVVTTESVAGNDTLKYAGLDYQGTDFSGNAQDVSGMDSLHLDFWTADSTALNVFLISSGPTEVAYALTVTPNTWVSVDIPLTAFAGVNLADIIQLKFDGNGTIWFDNLYFESSGPPPTEPVTAAPTPTEPEANVISLFSDAYTDIAGIDYNPGWGQATVVTTESVAGNDTLKYAGLDYQGTDFSGNAQDVSGMNSLHLDFWTADSTALNVFLISSGPTEVSFALTVTPHTWVSVDIPLTEFAGVNLADIIQLKFDGNGTIWLDNLYFSTAGGGGGPSGELAVNGDFETGDLTGWTTFDNGGTIEVSNPGAGGSANAGHMNVTIPGNPTLKQANLAAGSLTPGQQVTVSFDWKGTDANGGVVDAVLFSELSGGGVSQTDAILSGGGFPADWTTVGPLDITIGPDVSGGITLQITAICGGAAGCNSDIFIDNVSIVVP